MIQVASLPLFLLHWDANRYGTWLMLSAVPTYLLMADVGMVATAGNRMTMEMARGRAEHANRIFHSATVFMVAVWHRGLFGHGDLAEWLVPCRWIRPKPCGCSCSACWRPCSPA